MILSKFIGIVKVAGLQDPSWEDLADILWLTHEFDRYSNKSQLIVEQEQVDIADKPVELGKNKEPKIEKKLPEKEITRDEDENKPEETPLDLSDSPESFSSDQEDEADTFEEERADIYSEFGWNDKNELFRKAIDGIPLHVPGGSALPGKLSLGRSLLRAWIIYLLIYSHAVFVTKLQAAGWQM